MDSSHSRQIRGELVSVDGCEDWSGVLSSGSRAMASVSSLTRLQQTALARKHVPQDAVRLDGVLES